MGNLGFNEGTRVRCYDYVVERDCYVEGTVIEVGEKTVALKVDKDIHDGNSYPQRVGAIILLPLDGTATFWGKSINKTAIL